MGAIGLAGRDQLQNLIWVVNCNLQRLDGPVRGNGKIIQELEADFRGAGWNVVKVVWGSRYPHHDATSAWDALARLREANVPEPLIARMMGGNAVTQFAIEPFREPAV